MDIIEQLKRDEGYTRFPKPDSHNTLEIGYGFNLELSGMFEDEASMMLGMRVSRLQGELFAALPWVEKLDIARQGVLLNMGYEMGLQGLVAFHVTLTMVKAGSYPQAAADMRASLWYKQVPVRAERLAKQMESGEWQ